MSINSENQSEIERLYETPKLSAADKPIIEKFLADLTKVVYVQPNRLKMDGKLIHG